MDADGDSIPFNFFTATVDLSWTKRALCTRQKPPSPTACNISKSSTEMAKCGAKMFFFCGEPLTTGGGGVGAGVAVAVAVVVVVIGRAALPVRLAGRTVDSSGSIFGLLLSWSLFVVVGGGATLIVLFSASFLETPAPMLEPAIEVVIKNRL